MMLPPTGSHRTNGSGSSVGSGSRTASSGGSRSHHSSPAYQDVPTPPASYSSRRPSSNNTPTQHRPSNGNMYNMNQDDMNGYPSQLQHQQSSSSRRPSVAVEDYNQPRYDPYENQMNNAGYHGSGSGKQVPFLRLPNQQLEEEYDGPTEIDMDENDDDISHLTDPTIMTGPSFPQQHQHQPQYPPQVPYPSHGPQGIQYASYPPQPPPQIQQHIYVNQAHVPQAYRPPPPKPPVIHINPQAPLLPMQYNTNLPTHLHIYNRQDDRNLSNINADERALRIGLLVSEQEAQYGINMYDDIHAGDEPFLHRLIQSGYNEDEAVLIIFEIKHGPPNSHYVSKEPLPPQSAMKRQVSSVSCLSPSFHSFVNICNRIFFLVVGNGNQHTTTSTKTCTNHPHQFQHQQHHELACSFPPSEFYFFCQAPPQ